MSFSSSLFYSRNKAFLLAILIVTTLGLFSQWASASEPAGVAYGDYVKGENFSDVYFVDRDLAGNLVRRVFINESIFFTWQSNFNNVISLPDSTLSQLPIGALVLPKSGVVLVKIQSANEVYAVADGILRWVTSETVAVALYGENWADYVLDLPPTMFSSFEFGAPISGEEYVDTSIMKTRSELVASDDPVKALIFYVDPYSNAARQVREWSITRPSDATALERIASQPTAKWFGDWHRDTGSAVENYVTSVTATGALPVLVAYNIPNRDCGYYSSGGAANDDAYRTWIASFAASIGTRSAIVILEPDAISSDCVNDARLSLIAEAVVTLKAQPNITLYIDAGHDIWVNSSTMASRLHAANIMAADGFALNISNFYTNEENIAYGTVLSSLVGGKHFVLDTSRNGNGSNGEWCNPFGRSIGANPTTETGHSLVDAFLWIKPPGESDGTCNGGPVAGAWWAEYALSLVQ